MNSIYIAHNPFTVHTEFLVNGMQPAEGCKLTSYRESRLQQWIEKLFDELRTLFNGDEHYDITFKGVESDFLDLEEVALKAKEAGAEVRLHSEIVPPAEHRLEQIRKLWHEVAQHPHIAAHVQSNGEARAEVEAAFNRDFDVYVVATMSSGKSTLINAMLGSSLLPAANEATTATIVRIADNERMENGFSAQRVSREGNLLDEKDNVTAVDLAEWNSAPDTFSIHLEGNIKAIRERDNVRLVLTDTPGPNNSQDAEHGKITMKHIMDSKRNPLILYILNGTQLATQDDKNLLNMIAETMSKGGKQSKDRFIFVVSKMDEFDPEKESIPDVLQRIRAYLESNGIHEPTIYPVSAEFTRLLRLPTTSLTRKELKFLESCIDTFENVDTMNLHQYMPITDRVKRNLASKGLSPREVSSGLPAVEAMIDEYIDKYNLPYRLKRVHDALNSVIRSALNEAELVESLDRDENELRKIRAEVAKLEEKKAKGFDAVAFKERLKKERRDLPLKTMEMLEEHRRAIGVQLRKNGLSFQGKESLSEAQRIAEVAKINLQTLYTSSTATYEKIYEDSQDSAKKELKNSYENFVKDIFNDANEVGFPTLEKLKNSMKELSNDFNFNFSEDDIQSRDKVVGHQIVSASTWYKPWTWGNKKEVEIIEKEAYVDLQEFWKKLATKLDLQFRSLESDAVREIENGHGKLVDRMLDFMNHEFDEKFKALLDAVKEKITAGKNKEKDIASAKKLLDDISSIRKQLNAILSMEDQHG